MRLRLGLGGCELILKLGLGREPFYDDESEAPHIAEINCHLSVVLPLFKPDY